jgi:integrase
MSIRMIQGTAAGRRRTPLEDAYDQFRLERQGNRLSARTLASYDYHVDRFFAWLRAEHPQVRQFKDLTVDVMRVYRAEMASRDGHRGRPLAAETLQDSHATIRIFLRWADNEGHKVDPRLLKLPRVRVPAKEPTVYHIVQLRQILAACNPSFPQQELAVRVLVGSGVRISELCGIAVEAPDGLPDLMLDSVERGRVELRVRWDGGAKGKKSRRVPITPKLASAIKRYQARQRPDVEVPELLISSRLTAYDAAGIDTMLDRLQSRAGFRIHAHAFRHTFATVACQMGWNFERLRAAMGHADYNMLQKYVRLSTERDLGRKKEWAEFILDPEKLAR